MNENLFRLKLFLLSFDKKILKIGLINVFLRALTLGSKFLLIIYLAKCLSPIEMGRYGLFTASISYALYLIGLDYYTFANREIMGLPKKQWPVIIRDQTIFYFISYLIFFPVISIAFIYDLILWNYVIWFYLILTFEHLALEANRLLIAIQKPLHAGLISFIRAGSWIYIIIFIMVKSPESRDLITVWAGWATGVLLSLLVSCLMLYQLDWASVKCVAPDWGWIRSGLRTAFPFFVSTLALRGIYSIDRYFLKYFWGESAVGVYTFYSGIANIVQYFIDAAIVINYYPKLVCAYRFNRMDEFRNNLKQMTFAIIFSLVILMAASALFIGPLLSYIGKPVYTEKINIFWIMLAVNGVITIGYIPHYALYAARRDSDIITGTILAFLLCMFLYFGLTPYWGGEGTALAMFISSSFIWLYKYQKYRLYLKKNIIEKG